MSNFIGLTIENMSEHHAMINLVASVNETIFEITH
jgi:hypothetical protein